MGNQSYKDVPPEDQAQIIIEPNRWTYYGSTDKDYDKDYDLENQKCNVPKTKVENLSPTPQTPN